MALSSGIPAGIASPLASAREGDFRGSVPIPPDAKDSLRLIFDPSAGYFSPSITEVGTPVLSGSGNGKYWDLGTNDSLYVDSTNLDASLWTNPNGFTAIQAMKVGVAGTPEFNFSKGSNQFLCARVGDQRFQWLVYYDFFASSSNELAFSNAVADNASVVMAWVYNPQAAFGVRLEVYQNGVLVTNGRGGSGAGGSMGYNPADPLRIGARSGGENRPVQRAGVVYGYAGVLTATQIANNTAWIQANRAVP